MSFVSSEKDNRKKVSVLEILFGHVQETHW